MRASPPLTADNRASPPLTADTRVSPPFTANTRASPPFTTDTRASPCLMEFNASFIAVTVKEKDVLKFNYLSIFCHDMFYYILYFIYIDTLFN